MRDETQAIQATRYAVLAEVVLLIAETTDLERLLNELVSQVRRLLDFDRCTLALINDDGETYRLQTLVERRDVARAAGRVNRAGDDVDRRRVGQRGTRNLRSVIHRVIHPREPAHRAGDRLVAIGEELGREDVQDRGAAGGTEFADLVHVPGTRGIEHVA